MSNVKRVYAAGEVSFNYLQDASHEDAAFLGRLFLGPAMGLHLQYGPSRLAAEANEHGGRTTYYRYTVTGYEALSGPALDRLEALLRAHGTVETFDVEDVEAGR